MNGWIWASVGDANALFNYYIGIEALGPGPDSYYSDGSDSEWAPAIFSDGWRDNSKQEHSEYLRSVGGLLRDEHPAPGEEAAYAEINDFHDGVGPDDAAIVDGDVNPNINRRGAWFYRNL